MTIRKITFPRTERGNDPADHHDDAGYGDRVRGLISAAASTGDIERKAQDQTDDPGGDTHDALALGWSRENPHWRFTPAFGQWHVWEPARGCWVHDDRLRHLTSIRDFVRREAPAKHHSAAAIAGIANLARSNPGITMAADDWDNDPFLLGTSGAVIDLRIGEAIEDPKAAYITRQTSVPIAPPGTRAPVWEAFLERITRHDPTLISYLQTIAGYSITGSDREQAIFFANGPGGNGKGVFLNTLTAIIGDYAHVASGDLLLAAVGERHPTDMASLRGRRFVTASELRPGARWDEQRLKSLTGGDPVTARFMRQDEFTYRPQFTLVIAGNHRPSFAGVDEAIRRRLRLIPFEQVIPEAERDALLPEKLKAEYPGILRWMVEGCLAWQQQGLVTPESVRAASEQYLDAEDSLGQWIADRIDRCAPAVRALTSRASLHRDWLAWAALNGGPSWSAKAFHLALQERGFQPAVREGVRGFRDVELRIGAAGDAQQEGI